MEEEEALGVVVPPLAIGLRLCGWRWSFFRNLNDEDWGGVKAIMMGSWKKYVVGSSVVALHTALTHQVEWKEETKICYTHPDLTQKLTPHL
jgi:hypothetical protein